MKNLFPLLRNIIDGWCIVRSNDEIIQTVKLLINERFGKKQVTQVLEESGAKKNLISNMRQSKTPSIDKFARLAVYIGVSVDYLLGLSSERGYNKMIESENLTRGDVSNVLKSIRREHSLTCDESLSDFCKTTHVPLRIWLSLEFPHLRNEEMQFESGIEEFEKVIIKTLEDATKAEKKLLSYNPKAKEAKFEENFQKFSNKDEKESFQKISMYLVGEKGSSFINANKSIINSGSVDIKGIQAYEYKGNSPNVDGVTVDILNVISDLSLKDKAAILTFACDIKDKSNKK